MAGQNYARQFRTLKVTCANGTLQASPQVDTWTLGNILLYRLSIRVPAGHAGLTGVVVLYNGVAIFPVGQPPSFLVTTNETLGQDFNEEEVAAPLTIETFNTDVFDHSFYLRADVSVLLPTPGDTTVAALVPIA
jgi:hypothetical protein